MRPISLKRLGLIFLSFVLGACTLLLWAVVSLKPPKESIVIQNFYMHRAAFERLRTMLSEDNHLVRVASWGVQTTESLLSTTPPTKNLSLDRYKEYLALLKETGSTVALRGEGEPPSNVGIGVYASGFGGDIRHIDVCWMGHPPTNQVSSLDEFYENPKRAPAFRHIEGNWYLWADR